MSNQPYKTPNQSYPPRQDLPQGLAVSSMVCGILSLTLCGCVTAIPAVICGYLGMQQANQGRAGGKGMAVAGLVMGIVSLVFSVLVIGFYILMFAAFAASEM